MNNNFLAENKLKQCSEELHRSYTKCVAHADSLLVRYSSNFPEYTDHTLLHSVQVANICNELIWNSIDKLNEYELYILLMSALLHDVGMGLGHDECMAYKQLTGAGDYDDETAYIRDYHHELSARFIIDNYDECFIPNEWLAAAIAEVCKGHRKTDLFDKKLYPRNYSIDYKGKRAKVNLAYLAAVLRIADEMDISNSRNLMLQYAGFVPKNEKSAMEFQKHRSVSCEIKDGIFFVTAATDDEKEYKELVSVYEKLKQTFDCCVRAIKESGYTSGIKNVKGDISLEKKSDLIIDAEKTENGMVVRLFGRLNANSAPLFENKLAVRLYKGMKELVLDFKELTYVSSAGLRVILGAQKKMTGLGGEMVILNTRQDVMDIFRMTGFDDILILR